MARAKRQVYPGIFIGERNSPLRLHPAPNLSAEGAPHILEWASFGFTLIELLAAVVCFAFSTWFTITVIVNLWPDLRNKSVGLQTTVIAVLLVVGYVLAGCALYLLLRLLFLRGRPSAPPGGGHRKDEDAKC